MVRPLSLLGFLCLVGYSSPAAAAPADVSPELLRALRGASAITPEIDFREGLARSVRVHVPTAADEPVDQAFEYLERFAGLYGLQAPRQELAVAGVSGDRRAATVRLRQVAGGVPVKGGELVVSLLDGAVRATNGRVYGGLGPVPAPVLGRADAELSALDASPEGRVIGRSRTVLLPGEPARLAWRVVVMDTEGVWTRYIDAAGGDTLETVAQVPEAYDMIIQTAQNTNSDWCWDAGWEGQDTTWFEEGGMTAQYDGSQDSFDDGFDGYFLAEDLYDWFAQNLYEDSYNDDGAQLNLMVHVGMNWRNASWVSACGHFQFGDGYLQRDVLAHEYSHAMDSSAHDLEYKNESGAIDESFADVFGSLFDDDDSWVGDDLEVGINPAATCPALRSMADPTLCKDPDHYDNFKALAAGEDPECNRNDPDWNDCGYVHTNSGILNKAAWLLMEGGDHNGYHIKAIGRTKVAWLYHTVLTVKLQSDSDFKSARHDLVWTAEDWAEGHWLEFDETDVCQVRNAFASVGIVEGGADIDCDGSIDAVDEDADGDWTDDDDDNCPMDSNSSQSDVDEDGLGDACDPDIDDDGDLNATDNCPSVANANQKDTDNDGVGDVCDDEDHDGILDEDDNCPEVANHTQTDVDQDGIGDVCDEDMDGDGLDHAEDNCPEVPNQDQSDGDGDDVGDVCDNCIDVPNPSQKNCDGDEFGDACEEMPEIASFACDMELPELAHVWVHPLDMVEIPVCEDCGESLPQDWYVDVFARTSDGTPLRVVDDLGNQVGFVGREGLLFRPDGSAWSRDARSGQVNQLRRYYLEVSPEAAEEGVTMELSMSAGTL